MATIDILGVTHNYELTPSVSCSSAPTLIFIHGWLLSRNYWQPLTDRLSADYQCLTYDLRGFGESQPVSSLNATNYSLRFHEDAQYPIKEKHEPSPYSLAAYAQDLIILLEKLNITNAWLVGHSLGGSIALWGADCCPERVQGVICLNSGGGIYLKEEFTRFRMFGKQLVQLRPPWLPCLPGIARLFSRAMVHKPLERKWGKQRVIDFVQADTEAALGALLDSTTEAEVHLLPQIVARLKGPVYFLAGEQDMIMELKYVRHLASFHWLFHPQGGNIVEIPDCGHLSMLEQTDNVTDAIAEILRKETTRPSVTA
jgi:2-succinyl-6-hydroxy-2,4-cyclohexadiene-1-carboxylate synthase